MTNETIAQVVKDGLCTGCGTCIALCPEEAIELRIDENKGLYIPELNEEKCNNCGTCYKVCPGHEVDFKELNLEIFGNESEDVLIGNYLNCYIGHSTDYNIRYNSSSGGLVTQLLIFALEEGIIDGALVTRMKKDNPLEPEPFIARTKEEIIEASKSKYCPVPANIALKEILKEEGKFAIVGLPCHIHGIRKAEHINKNLKEKIILHFGIFCGGCLSFFGTTFMLQKMGIRKEDVKKIDYRGEGWPGGVKIILKNNKIIFRGYWYNSGFSPLRCTLCCDHTCELSDISFGDAWLPELKDDKVGRSMVISRNEIGEQLLRNSISLKKIELNKTKNNKILQSQWDSLYFRKMLRAHTTFFKLLGKDVPTYNTELVPSNFNAYLNAILIYLRIYISSKRYLWHLLGIFNLILWYIYACIKYYESRSE